MALFEGRELACHRGGRDVFENLTFALDGGDALLVTGPNGSGKSSLLRILAGLLKPSAGALFFQGKEIAEDISDYQRHLCYVGHAEALKPVLTARENLAFWNRAGSGEAVTSALVAVALSSLQDTPVRLLSQGQKRRLALARLVVAKSVVWLLDEPTVGLDSESLGAIESKLADHRAAGGIVVVSTHGRIKLPDATTIALEDYAVLRAAEMIW